MNRLCTTLAALVVIAWGGFARADGGPAPSAASAAKVKLPDSPGSVRGLGSDADVSSFSGQVSYGVPFDLPSGRAGFGPALGLSYSGELGNGPVGVGWQLAAPVIRRSVRHGVPSYTDADELEMVGIGGGRLVLVEDGPYRGEYRVEGAGNAWRVQRDGARFVATDSDGTRYFFGLTAASRQDDGAGRVAAWHLELAAHRSGEAIYYDYRADGGRLYLERIAWGPDRRYAVEVTYEQRPDPVVSFRTGSLVTTALRATHVGVRSLGEELRAYYLTYDDSFALSRLASVAMTGYQARGTLPSVTFSYGARRAPGVVELAVDGWALEQRGVTFHDFDGDGMADLYRAEMGNHEVRLGRGAGFGPRQPVPGASAYELEQIRLLDLDGDARAELVRIVDDTWRYSRRSGDGWATVGVWPGTEGVPLHGPGVELADIDGDGRTDVLQAVTGGVRVWQNGPAGLLPPRIVQPIDPAAQYVELGEPGVAVVDVNGDGLDDVAYMTDAWMKVYLGRGDGTFAPWRRVFYPWAGEALDVRNVRLADLDRDGVVDLVRFTAGHVLWFAGRSDGGFSAIPRSVPRPDGVDADVVVAIADANGNGSQDVVWSSPRGMWVLDLAGATTAGMLDVIDNGLGKLVSIEYASSAELSVEADAAGTPWDRLLPVAVPVPVSMTVDVGDGSPVRAVHYGVRDGAWDGVERRFAGFLEAREASAGGEDGSDLAVTVTQFHEGIGNDRVLRGRARRSWIEDDRGRRISATETAWLARPVADLPPHPLLRVAVAQETRGVHYEGVTEPIETRAWFVHDGQGRVVEEHDEGRLDLEGDEAVVTRTYATDDTTAWIRDRVLEEMLLEADGTIVSRVRTLYGDERGPVLPPGQIGAGLVRRTEGWLAEETRWVRLSEVYEYDDAWNPVAAYGGGVDRSFGYHASGLFLDRESVVPEPGRTLTWTATWNEVRGIATAVTDPSGVTARVTYDDLGRVQSIAQGNRPPHAYFVYDWRAPRPMTYSVVFDGPEDELPDSGPLAPEPGWRHTRTFTNGAGEPLYSATQVRPNAWLVSGWITRDARGRAVAVTEPFEWVGASVRDVAGAPASWPTHTATYDALDRITATRTPTGAERSTAYWAFGQQVTVGGLEPVTTALDGRGRITRTERPVGGIVESVDAHYDAAGRLRAMRLQDGLVSHEFVYDSLGRMTFATDPDIGDRHLLYDDAGRLLEHTNGAGQTVEYGYDLIGRLTSVTADDGSAFGYHYDEPIDPSYQFTAGRLAWVEEPTGRAQVGYDAWGRAVRATRAIDGRAATEHLAYAPSGLLRRIDYDHELAVEIAYDRAGRPVSVRDATALGELWAVDEYDAAGRILRERYGNGVEQGYVRDADGQPQVIGIRRSDDVLYDVLLGRNGYGAITSIDDRDGRGLDHSATFTYDGGGRLTAATIGAGLDQYAFSYRYDGLQNMIERTATGPRELGVLAGVYRYGESGAGPRQLTSIAPDALPGTPASSTFSYDAAGRQITHDGKTLVYNGLDQLIRVEGLPAGTVQHAYGYDGLRVRTIAPDGATQIWFSESITERNGRREHYIRVGSRVIAKITQEPDEPGAGSASAWLAFARGADTADALRALVLAAGLLFVLWIAWHTHGKQGAWAHVTASLAITAVAASGCTMFGTSRHRLWRTAEIVYFHTGASAGPFLFTDADGLVIDERRYEPFGEELDAWHELPSGGGVVSTIDYRREPTNILNKQTDPDTGWSYHGARWLAPETARWLTPDPPVKAPDPKFMAEPWALHPYQYVNQNPVLFWDPDGQDKSPHEYARDQLYDPDNLRGEMAGLNRYEPADVAEMKNASLEAWIAFQAGGGTLREFEQQLFDQLIDESAAWFEANGMDVAEGQKWLRVRYKLLAQQNIADPAWLIHKAYRLYALDTYESEKADAITFGLAGLGGALGGSGATARTRNNRRTPKGCFVAGTLIATVNGARAIEEVQVGEMVLARDEQSGSLEWGVVRSTFVRDAAEIYEVVVERGDERRETLQTTAEHPFWVSGRGWVIVAEIASGDHLLDADGHGLTVITVRRSGERARVYNIEVDTYHTYFVGELRTWVHNKAMTRQWTKKARIKDAKLPTRGKVRYVPPKNWHPSEPLPRGPQNGYMDKFGNEWTRGPSRTAGEPFEWDVQLPDGSHWNISLKGRVTH